MGNPNEPLPDFSDVEGGSSSASMPEAEAKEQTETYTVKSGDTLNGILDRYKRGMLDPCWVGPTELTVNMVWEHEANKQKGFIAHPTKRGIRGRRANYPNWIYAGEKIAFPGSNLRTQEYRGYFAGFLG